MGDVTEFIVDGTSGLSPGDVSGSILVVGCCSDGIPGKAYLLGKDSDLDGLLGAGELVTRLRDIFATGGQNPVVVAVPVDGLPGGYITPVVHMGTGPEVLATGSPILSADVVVEIVAGGVRGTATYRTSMDGGETFGIVVPTPVNGIVSMPDTGATLTLTAGTYVGGDLYRFVVMAPIGPVSYTCGTGGEGFVEGITVSGTVVAGADVVFTIVSSGGWNEGTYKLSVDGGDSWDAVRTIPVDGMIDVGNTGTVITVGEGALASGDTYTFILNAPVPSISEVMTVIALPLELYDVESVYVVGPSDAVDWATMGAMADTLWNAHRPTYFRAETRIPYYRESIDSWVADLVAEVSGFAHRFVTVCAAAGEVSDTTGKRLTRNWGGLLAGRMMALPVMRAAGRVRDGGISQGSLPDDFTSAHQTMLEKAGYVTAKRYAGLSAAYWGDGRTMADPTSDYQYEEVVRTVFKAVRKARIAALKSMYDEAGDALLEGGAAGINYLRANIETALSSMVAAVPSEMAGFVVEIPPGQDIVNNGVAVNMTLIGLPIIRSIKLYASYVYAGSAFDPRLV
jgi:hypothetical protein